MEHQRHSQKTHSKDKSKRDHRSIMKRYDVEHIENRSGFGYPSNWKTTSDLYSQNPPQTPPFGAQALQPQTKEQSRESHNLPSSVRRNHCSPFQLQPHNQLEQRRSLNQAGTSGMAEPYSILKRQTYDNTGPYRMNYDRSAANLHSGFTHYH
jgi:hypothetical protein